MFCVLLLYVCCVLLFVYMLLGVLLFVSRCVLLFVCSIHVSVNRLQKIVMEALDRPAAEMRPTASFFAEIFTRVTVVSYNLA